MAGLRCCCGMGMSNSDCPSPFMMDIYYAKEINIALQEFPNIQLIDFLLNWDEEHNCQHQFMLRADPADDYWFCTRCKRIYEFVASSRRWVRLFERQKAPFSLSDISNWQQLYVLTDTDIDTAFEKKEHILLREYLSFAQPYEYYLSPDEKQAYALNTQTRQVDFIYRLQADWSPEQGEQWYFPRPEMHIDEE